jgi:hypothetical protein
LRAKLLADLQSLKPCGFLGDIGVNQGTQATFDGI